MSHIHNILELDNSLTLVRRAREASVGPALFTPHVRVCVLCSCVAAVAIVVVRVVVGAERESLPLTPYRRTTKTEGKQRTALSTRWYHALYKSRDDFKILPCFSGQLRGPHHRYVHTYIQLATYEIATCFLRFLPFEKSSNLAHNLLIAVPYQHLYCFKITCISYTHILYHSNYFQRKNYGASKA